MFDAPTTGTSISPVDVENHVLVVEPIEFCPKVTTAFGESDAVRFTVHDITDQTTYTDVLWFSKALVGMGQRNIGKRLLGVMGKGEAKPGQSAPWILIDATGNETAVQAATVYLNSQTAATIAAPVQEPKAESAPAGNSTLDAALANLNAAGLTK